MEDMRSREETLKHNKTKYFSCVYNISFTNIHARLCEKKWRKKISTKKKHTQIEHNKLQYKKCFNFHMHKTNN